MATERHDPDGAAAAGERPLRLVLVDPPARLLGAVETLAASPHGPLVLHLSAVPAGERPGPPGEPPGTPIHRLPLPAPGGRLRFLPVAEIDWIEAADQYVRIHAGPARHLVRESMARLEAGLDPRRFLRVHRSAIVHLERVAELHAESPRSRWVVLRGGERLRVGPHQWQRLHTALAALP